MELCNNCNQYAEKSDINEFGNCRFCSPVKSAVQRIEQPKKSYKCSACSVVSDPSMIGHWNCCKDLAAIGGEEPYPVEVKGGKMYLKVPDRKLPGGQFAHDTTVEEVQQALPTDVDGLTVDMTLGYPSVSFEDGTHAIYKRVQKHLAQQGFAAY